MRILRTQALVLTVILSAGCVYYNGMYRAEHFAEDAREAEREGRTIQAQSLWGKVGVKADTVLARHGDSEWADDALYLRALAWERLDDCQSAIPALEKLIASTRDPALSEKGTFLLGTCWAKTGNASNASAVFARLINATDPARRDEALFQHGRSLRLGGQYAEALPELRQTSRPGSRGERAAALAGLGRLEAAELVVDSLLQAGDLEAPWDSIIVLSGRHDPAFASRLVDRLVVLPGVDPEQQSHWLMQDALLLARTDLDAGLARLRQADSIAKGTGNEGMAPLHSVRLRLHALEGGEGLDSLLAQTWRIGEIGGSVGGDAQRLALILEGVAGVLDSVTPGTGQGDIQLFLAAETARDSLDAPGVSEFAFRRLLQDFPDSPYAPKAILALVALGNMAPDSALALIQRSYPRTPYLTVAEGIGGESFTQLEDSLRLYTVRFNARVRRANSEARSRERGIR